MRLAVLGAEILQAVFEWHFSRRQQILTLAQTKLLGTTADAAMPFVRLLACLVRNQYGLLSAHLDQLRVSFQILKPKSKTFVDPKAVEGKRMSRAIRFRPRLDSQPLLATNGRPLLAGEGCFDQQSLIHLQCWHCLGSGTTWI